MQSTSMESTLFHVGNRLIYLLIILMLLCILITSFPGASREPGEYDPLYWSKDIQITKDDPSEPRYKRMMSVQESNDGGFIYLYERGDTHDPLDLMSYGSNKLGETSFSKNFSCDMFGFNQNWYVDQTAWIYRFNEFDDSVSIVHRWSGRTLKFLKLDFDGDVIDEHDFTMSQLFNNVTNLSIENRVEGCWDEYGRSHVVVTASRTIGSDSNLKFYYIYLRTTWKPYSIYACVFWESPVLDTSSWNRKFNDLLPYLAVSPSGHVAIVHTAWKGLEATRTVSILDPMGNWSRVDISDVDDDQMMLYAAFSGIFIDDDNIVHVAWVHRPLSVLIYANLTLSGNITCYPKQIEYLPLYERAHFMRVQMGRTSGGDFLIAYNLESLVMAKQPTWPRTVPELHIVVVPSTNFSGTIQAPIRLVQGSYIAECRLIIDSESVFVFWFDMRTGRTELFMKYLASPGLTFAIDLEEWANAQYIKPNETKIVHLNLVNVGTVGFLVSMSAESDADIRWSIRLDSYRAELGPHQTIPVNLTISCPSGASHGDSVRIWINATTGYKEYEARLRLVIVVIWERLLDVDCPQRHHLVEPGELVEYRISVKNNGELPERVTVETSAIGPIDWEYNLEVSSFHLESHCSRILSATVRAPLQSRADDVFTLIMFFYWEDGTSAHAGLVLRTVVEPTFFVIMDVNRTSAIIAPGMMAEFNLTVGNIGNTEGTAFIEIEVLTDPRDWTILLSGETVVLKSGQRETLRLSVNSSPLALFGEILVIKVRAYSPSPFSEVIREVRVEIDKVISISWPSGPLEFDIYPSHSGYSLLTLRNDGNLWNNLDLSMEGLPDTWVWWLEDEDIQISSVRIGPDESVILMVWVGVDSDAEAGLYNTRLYIDANSVTLGYVEIRIAVAQVRDITLVHSGHVTTLYQGGFFEAEIIVKNKGNGADLVDLEVTKGDLEELEINVDDLNSSSVWVPSDGTRTITLCGFIPNTALIGLNEIIIKGRARDDSSITSIVHITYQVIEPNLRISTIEIIPSKPQVNEIITVRLHLYNDAPIEIVNLCVIMNGGGEESIASIAPFSESTAVFSWVSMKSGRVTISGNLTFGPGNHSMYWDDNIDIQEKEPVNRFPQNLLIILSIVSFICVSVFIFRLKQSNSG